MLEIILELLWKVLKESAIFWRLLLFQNEFLSNFSGVQVSVLAAAAHPPNLKLELSVASVAEGLPS